MIYIKRLLNAEVGDKPRNIGLKNDIAESFFNLNIGTKKKLTFIDKINKHEGELTSVTGNNPQITGEFFSYIKSVASLNDLLVFYSTSDDSVFGYKIINKNDDEYSKYNWLIDLYGTKYQSTSTHLLIHTDAEQPTQNTPSLPTPTDLPDFPLQQIFYGAPGTGKSHTVDKICATYTHYRTTFHPDSDYSTFVGAYKPVCNCGERIYDKSELIVKLNSIKSSGVSYPCQKFGTKYWESLKTLAANEIKEIVTSCGFSDTLVVEANKGVAIGEELMPDQFNSRISYSFSPQSFTQAYVEAWKNYRGKDDYTPVFLIIEEINRGNCAQIFGDIFQLLDRDGMGFSKYEIVPDVDLMKYLSNQKIKVTDIKDSYGKDISSAINSGTIMKLPPNLYIWATMNTSDQSLFPIDSAFKRRWDWKYVKIKDEDKGWTIANTEKTGWWDFLKAVNRVINEMTSSADKQLGYFFCKPKKNETEISAETFVGKVIFYLWNDVFKDYGFDDTTLFRYNDSEGRSVEISFPSFYDEDGEKINKDVMDKFIQNVLNWRKDKESEQN